ncbi:MAG TPA: IS1182 family transposase [Xanthomonadales bacterium]|nr:IS1182 family transposase [Xanthomonadales bacterium]
MGEQGLFGDLGGARSSKKQKRSEGAPRVKRPDRRQSLLRAEVLDQLLPIDHRARAIVAAVDQLDLSAFYEGIAARGSDPGRPATDPAMLVSLWLFATSEGVGSGRQLARLCERDDAYRWICGGVAVNQHTLSDFRVQHGKELDELLTQLLGVLMHKGLLQLKRVAQDGMRVRAHAGAASFRRKRALRKCLAAARDQVKRVRALLDQDDVTRSDRQRAAQERAARERQQLVQEALEALKEVQAMRKLDDDDEETQTLRASTTDPEARVMRMADGGFRPGYNVQLATDTDARVIVGVTVTNSGSDLAQMTPMLEDIEQRTGRKPKELLVDGGYVNLEQIEQAGADGVKVFAPPQQPRNKAIDATKPKDDDGPHVAAWRKRMGSERAAEIYRERGSVAECVNADLREHRGLRQLPVRGIDKALSISLWMALAFNVMQWIKLAPPLA